MTYDVHKWIWSRQVRKFTKAESVHLNVPRAFAYSEKRKLKLQNPGKGIQFTVTENGSLLYTNEFPPNAKRNARNNQKTSVQLVQGC